MFSIYHSGRTFSPFFVCETLDRLLNRRIEIRANTIRVTSVVVVRITVVVDISEISGGYRECPFEFIVRFSPTF